MKWKQSFNALVLAVCVAAVQIPSVAATIKWYTDVPQVTAPSGTMVLSLQTNATGYGYVLLSTLLNYIGGSPSNQLTIIYATTNINNYTWVTNMAAITINASNAYIIEGTVSNLYATNLIVESNAYFYETNFVNYNYTTNLFVTSNAYFYETNFINYDYTTNLFVTSNAYFYETNFVNYEYVTNLYVTTNAYFYATNFVNYEYVTNLTVESNAYFYETNFVNYDIVTNLTVESNAYFFETNFVNYDIVTNLNVESNAYFYETNFVNNEYVTNLYVVNEFTVYSNVTVLGTISYPTNAWSGPTNVLDCSVVDQNYTASGNMAVTGLSNKPTTNAANVLLTILASGADRTIYLTGSFVTGDGERSYVCTNGSPRSFWFRYTPALGGWSNVCDRSFY